MKRRLDPEKLAKLKTADQHFAERYGAKGTPTRIAFHERAITRYYAEILRDRRKELKITQQQLAEQIGKDRSYIAYLERGETDMQMSNFLRISNALGLGFSLHAIQ